MADEDTTTPEPVQLPPLHDDTVPTPTSGPIDGGGAFDNTTPPTPVVADAPADATQVDPTLPTPAPVVDTTEVDPVLATPVTPVDTTTVDTTIATPAPVVDVQPVSPTPASVTPDTDSTPPATPATPSEPTDPQPVVADDLAVPSDAPIFSSIDTAADGAETASIIADNQAVQQVVSVTDDGTQVIDPVLAVAATAEEEKKEGSKSADDPRDSVFAPNEEPAEGADSGLDAGGRSNPQGEESEHPDYVLGVQQYAVIQKDTTFSEIARALGGPILGREIAAINGITDGRDWVYEGQRILLPQGYVFK